MPLIKLLQSTLCGKCAGVRKEGILLLLFSLLTQGTEISRNAHIYKLPVSLHSYVAVRHLTPQQQVRAKNKSGRAGCIWYSGPTGWWLANCQKLLQAVSVAHSTLAGLQLGSHTEDFRVTPCITPIFSHGNKCDLTFKHLQLSLTSLGSVETFQIKE